MVYAIAGIGIFCYISFMAYINCSDKAEIENHRKDVAEFRRKNRSTRSINYPSNISQNQETAYPDEASPGPLQSRYLDEDEGRSTIWKILGL